MAVEIAGTETPWAFQAPLLVFVTDADFLPESLMLQFLLVSL